MDAYTTSDIGNRLRNARQQRGLSLHDAASLTKLSTTVLQAMERSDFESLPPGIYRTGYLRTLAAEVGLNPAEIVADYRDQCQPAVEVVPRGTHVAVEGRFGRLTSSPRRAAIVLAVLIGLAIAWLAFGSSSNVELTTAAGASAYWAQQKDISSSGLNQWGYTDPVDQGAACP